MASQTQMDPPPVSSSNAPARTRTASTKVTAKEFAELEKLARGHDLSTGEWIREVLLREIERTSGGELAPLILTEIVSLQLFLTEVLSSIASGVRITAEHYDMLMQKVKASKHHAARQVITRYITENKENHGG